MKSLEQEAKEIFEVHPKLNVVYITSDGIGYESEHNANQHAKDLKNKTVAKFEREQNPSNKEQGTGDNGKQTESEGTKSQVEGNDELNEGDVNAEPSNKVEEPSERVIETTKKGKGK